MKFFTLKTKDSVLCNLNGNKANYSFKCNGLTEKINELRKEIELQLHLRNYDVPGVDVEFCLSSDSDNNKRIFTISEISSSDPDIEIRSDYQIRYRGCRMSLHEDQSGHVDMYCGSNWEKDQKEFAHGINIHRKMNNKSRILLQYQKHDWGYDNFEATDDCGRGHYPDGSENEPLKYSVRVIEAKFIEGLRFLLSKIKATKPQIIDKELFAEPDPILLTNSLFQGTLFHTKVSLEVKERIRYNSENNINYGTDGGYRLLPLGIAPPKTHPYHLLMNDGFIYCDIESNGEIAKNWDHSYSDRVDAIVTVKNFNNVFVIDANIDDFRNKWFEENPNETRLSNDAVKELQIMRAKTLVHINKYRGNYKKPVIAICRVLSTDEITINDKQNKNA